MAHIHIHIHIHTADVAVTRRMIEIPVPLPMPLPVPSDSVFHVHVTERTDHVTGRTMADWVALICQSMSMEWLPEQNREFHDQCNYYSLVESPVFRQTPASVVLALDNVNPKVSCR